MKQMILMMTLMLMGLTSSTVTAQHKQQRGKDYKNSHHRFAEPIVFMEHGVEFFIFPDGNFDFNTHRQGYNKQGRPLRRSSVKPVYDHKNNGVIHSGRRGRGTYIKYDPIGQIRRIDNIFIDYDRRGKVRRIGSIEMQYHRGKGRLKQVGGLRVNYNHWGEIVHTRGVVNPFNGDLYCGNSQGYEPYAFRLRKDRKTKYNRRSK